METADTTSIYEKLMAFIDKCNDPKILKNMLVESIDNRDEEDLYNNYVKNIKS